MACHSGKHLPSTPPSAQRARRRRRRALALLLVQTSTRARGPLAPARASKRKRADAGRLVLLLVRRGSGRRWRAGSTPVMLCGGDHFCVCPPGVGRIAPAGRVSFGPLRSNRPGRRTSRGDSRPHDTVPPPRDPVAGARPAPHARFWTESAEAAACATREERQSAVTGRRSRVAAGPISVPQATGRLSSARLWRARRDIRTCRATTASVASDDEERRAPTPCANKTRGRVGATPPRHSALFGRAGVTPGIKREDYVVPLEGSLASPTSRSSCAEKGGGSGWGESPTSSGVSRSFGGRACQSLRFWTRSP